MGAGASSMMGPEGYGRGWGQTSLGDMPESCVAAVLLYLDPPEICQVARLNQAFRGAASADCVWAAKLPANYRYLAALAAAADDESDSDGATEGNGSRCSSVAAMIKKEIYARLCRPTPFDGGTKVDKAIETAKTKARLVRACHGRAGADTGLALTAPAPPYCFMFGLPVLWATVAKYALVDRRVDQGGHAWMSAPAIDGIALRNSAIYAGEKSVVSDAT
ncbi:hypothetical protein E2562_024186 [Oryza meyeriana var. granulata]|uniref:F-box domain-containing protein n=1 Tax=Oryza meyeriana var. granulata TaxID=110450 RepID=A0A6G1C185_9ORYZ|nr:hypothetical protein E2562_024186 [Oryza meyeriana var. granulata]